jgi:hypothetical protein
MNPFQKKSPAPPALSTPGTKPKAIEEPLPAQPEKPATEPGKVVISPEMVCFRSADEICTHCTHWGQDGNCEVLNMQVTEGDSCNAFTEREDGASDIADPNEAMEQEQQ